ncbi:hypothetical protein [Jiangella muralis]|uniref:hypothetical protein n=1 Tax=Jiangella muralis TaxID=702383 RepID=UPI00069E863F|nr:hypothetical protein [Jiangella muralis]
MTDRDVRQCSLCGADVVWAITAAGKRQPLNATPDPAGNVAAHRDGTGTRRARAVVPDRPLMGFERLYMPHAATCAGGLPNTPRTPTPPRALPIGVADMNAYRARKARAR